MRVILWVFGLALSGTAVAAPVTGIGEPAYCRDNPSLHWTRPGARGQFHKLTDLPPARAYYPMLERGADGCFTPVLFGTRSGAGPARRGRTPIVPRSFP